MARILIAEDDADIRQLVTHTLADEGYEIATAKDGTSALDMMLANPPDLLVLDLMMPGIDGFGVLEAMQESGLKDTTKVLVLTAKGSESDWERGFELGADQYMTKPFDPDEVVDSVKDLLSLSKEELKAKREQELDKAHLLSQLESLFGE